jgi:hypothetical protein
MKRATWWLSIVAVLSLTAKGRVAHAANPTTKECLAASDASMQTSTPRAERAQLVVCASRACPTDIRQECAARLGEVTAKIPTILFTVLDASGQDLKAVKITMDSELLTARLDGKALAVDPGEHMFTFDAAGQPKVTKTFTLREGEKDRPEVVRLVAAEMPAPPPPVAAQVSRPALPSTPAPPSPPKATLGPQKIVALVAGGVGLVGLVVGGSFGVAAISKKSAAQSACPGVVCTTEQGVDAWRSAHGAGNVSNVGFILGGVGVAGALALWFTAPSSSSLRSTQLALGVGSLRLRGTF